jgi:hypothetical protein
MSDDDIAKARRTEFNWYCVWAVVITIVSCL